MYVRELDACKFMRSASGPSFQGVRGMGADRGMARSQRRACRVCRRVSCRVLGVGSSFIFCNHIQETLQRFGDTKDSVFVCVPGVRDPSSSCSESFAVSSFVLDCSEFRKMVEKLDKPTV